jgi:hypothetical protein
MLEHLKMQLRDLCITSTSASMKSSSSSSWQHITKEQHWTHMALQHDFTSLLLAVCMVRYNLCILCLTWVTLTALRTLLDLHILALFQLSQDMLVS